MYLAVVFAILAICYFHFNHDMLHDTSLIIIHTKIELYVHVII